MIFDSITTTYSAYVAFLPLLAIPLILLFIACGKGLTTQAWYFSLSVPGLVITAVDVVAEVAAEHFAGTIANTPLYAAALLLDPAIWIFPLVWATQVIHMVRGAWTGMRLRSVVMCLFLLSLHVWNAILINIDND
jgi:hypothetical protein